MVDAYPGDFYPGQVYPGQDKPPTHAGDTTWGSWRLGHTGVWIRRETRVLVWAASGTGTHLLTDTGSTLTTEAGDRLTT